MTTITPVLPTDDTRPRGLPIQHSAPIPEAATTRSPDYRIPALALLAAIAAGAHHALWVALLWSAAGVAVFGLGLGAVAEHLPVIEGWVR